MSHLLIRLRTGVLITTENYNIIGFDQRGMGRSLPSFANTDCAMTTHDPDFAILNSIEFDQPETIRAGAKVWKARSLACWNHPEFKLTLHKEQGVQKTYHFLEYSGTRQLAEDIERVRQLFGDQKLNLYGLSYGTKVNDQLVVLILFQLYKVIRS